MTAITVTRASFDEAVLRASATRPVLVDFWAPWCAPCRALAPILERLAAEFADRFALAKLDTDAEPELAARYGVRGIPNCKLFVDGKVVDEFTGALPEGALRDFLVRALPSRAAPLVAEAKALLARKDPANALARVDDALALDPDDEDALLTRAETLLALNRTAEAASVVDGLEAPVRARLRPVRDGRRLAALRARAELVSCAPAFSAVAAALPCGGAQFASRGGTAALVPEAGADLATLALRAAATPVDCAAKLAHARALAAAGDYEQALAELLAIVRTDRGFEDDIGRRTMLTVFDALPGDSDIARRYRRELAAAIH